MLILYKLLQISSLVSHVLGLTGLVIEEVVTSQHSRRHRRVAFKPHSPVVHNIYSISRYGSKRMYICEGDTVNKVILAHVYTCLTLVLPAIYKLSSTDTKRLSI